MSAAFTDPGSGNSELEFLNSILFSEDFPSHVVLMIQYGFWSCVPVYNMPPRGVSDSGSRVTYSPRGHVVSRISPSQPAPVYHTHNLHLSITLTTRTWLHSHSPPAPVYLHTQSLYKTSLHCCVLRVYVVHIAMALNCQLPGYHGSRGPEWKPLRMDWRGSSRSMEKRSHFREAKSFATRTFR